MAYESWHMQHCVGQFDDRKNLTGGYGEYYANQIEQHKLRLFSLRDNNNIPHVTIALNVVGDSLEIDQIKGKQNRHPVKKYADDVCLFCNYYHHKQFDIVIVKVWVLFMKIHLNIRGGNM